MHVFTHIQKITFHSQLVLKHQQNRKRGFCCHHHCCTIVHNMCGRVKQPPLLRFQIPFKKLFGDEIQGCQYYFLKLPKLFLRTQVNCKKEITKSFKEMSTYLYPICYYIHNIDILFPSNHNIQKSSCSHCFWVSDPRIERLL